MSKVIYEEITNKIIEQLEQGAIPWVKPWRVDSSADKNVLTQKPYQGINRIILGMSSIISGFNTPVWASYKQWSSLGANVKKGEKGTKIVFYSPIEKENKQTGETEKYAVLKAYWIFNAAQVEGIEIQPVATENREFNSIEDAEQRIIKTGAAIGHGGDAAFYMPSQDRIQMPNKSSFESESSYYATVFHELTHWTGSDIRLKRQLKNRFGDSKYAFEELVAEMGAAFLCEDYKIKGELRHAGYIQHWLRACKDDSRAIFKAAAMAQKAADYINMLDATTEAIAA